MGPYGPLCSDRQKASSRHFKDRQMAIINHTGSKFIGRFITAAVVLNTAVAAWGMLDPGHAELTEKVETGLLVLFGGELVLRARSEW